MRITNKMSSKTLRLSILVVSLGLFLNLSLNEKASSQYVNCGTVCGSDQACISRCQNENNLVNSITNDSRSASNAQIIQEGNISVSQMASTDVSVNSPPSAYAHTHLYNGVWNFIPPHILFDPSKVIGDGSVFCNCRLIKLSTTIRHSVKDKLFGVFDERAFVMSGIGNVKPMPASGPGIVSDSVIVCGLNVRLPRGCVQFIGSGHVFMENYATTEGALVGLAQMAAVRGGNLVGNVNCAYAETVQSFGVGLGAGGGGSKEIEHGMFEGTSVSGSVGGSWSTGITKRPAQPFCTGDFYVATLDRCSNNGVAYMPAPRSYRRYLPSNTPPISQTQYLPPAQQPVRGYW